MSMHQDTKAILDEIRRSSRVVVVSHTNPDADAYGSTCGLSLGLAAYGIPGEVYNESGFISRYGVIPGARGVIKGPWAPLTQSDLLIVCDCGAVERVGDSLIELVKTAARTINIDHHTANNAFGHLNYIIEGASSTSELVFNLNHGQFAEVAVAQEMLARCGADILDADSLAERARDIEGVRVAALYKQDVDMWRVSLRSRQGTVDVSAIAQSFGGGGHKPAAAFRWRRDLETLQSQLRAAISKVL